MKTSPVRLWHIVLISLLLTVFSGLLPRLAHAADSTVSLREGKDYTVIKATRIPASRDGRVEILNFFWYGCGHCSDFDPKLREWARQHEKTVTLRMVPVAFTPRFMAHTQLYETLLALGEADRLLPKVADEIQHKKHYLLDAADQADFAARNGIDRQRFVSTSQSFEVQTAIKRDVALTDAYKINATPMVIVAGKYLTSPEQTNSLDGTVKVIDALVQAVRAKRL